MPLPTLPKQPSSASDPESMRSLMRSIGQGTMSGMAAVGNMLNKPSRALWGSANFLTGGDSGGGLLNLIPFSDTMGLTDPNQGIELSKFLGNQGLLPQNDESKWEWMDPVRGAVDIVGDPTSWLGVGALTKTGLAASKAGRLTKGFLPSIRAGERSLLGINVPFGTKPIGNLFTGAKTADNLAKAGKVAAKVPGVKKASAMADSLYRLGRANFDNTVAGTIDARAQSTFEDLTKEQKSAVAGIKTRLGTVAQILNDAGLTSKADRANLRHHLETGRWLRRPHEAQKAVVPELMKLREDVLKMQQDGGMKASRIKDESGIDYWFRQTNGSGKSSRESYSTSGPMVAGSKSSARRQNILRGGATHWFNRLATDKKISRYIEQKLAAGAKKKAIVGTVVKAIRKKYAGKIIDDTDALTKNGKPIWERDASGKIKTDAAGNKIPARMSRHLELAKALVGKSGAKWRAQGGIFVNDPIADAMKLAVSRAERSPIGSHLSETLAKHAGPGRGTTRIGDIIRKANQGKIGLDADAIANKIYASRNGGKSLGAAFPKRRQYIKARNNILRETVDDTLAAELTKPWDSYKGPSALEPVAKAFDSASALWKAGMLSWPGRITRDFTSGVARMWDQGWLTKSNVGDASKILRGQAVEGLENIPAIRQAVADMGLDLTPENAARAYKSMYNARHGRSGITSGDIPPPMGAGVEDVVNQFPGQVPETYGQMLGNAGSLFMGKNPATGSFESSRFNPLNIRGVGGRTETKFGPAAASDVLGGHADSLTRMASDLELLRQGYDPQEAAKLVSGAFADYSKDALTQTEQQIRRILPFYNFAKSQAIHTAKDLTKNPGGRMGQMIGATADMQDKDPTTPEYVQQTTSIPLGTLEDGSKRYLTGLGLMHEGPLGYLGGGAQGMLMQGLSQVNPLIKAPIEYATGESFFQRGPTGGRDLGDLDPTVGRLLSNVGVSTGLMPEGSDAIRYPGMKQVEFLLGNSPISRALTTARSLSDPRKGVLAKGANFLTGARVSDISPAAQDAVLRDAATAFGKGIGAKEFSRISFSKDQIAEMKSRNPEAAKIAEAFNALQKQLSDRQKRRKKDKEAAAK